MQIYIATQDGCDSPCKIGHSFNPVARARSLSTGSPIRVVIRATTPCAAYEPNWGSSSPHREIEWAARQAEAEAHRRLAIFRVRGEWFDIDWRSALVVVQEAVNDRLKELLANA